jgi:hypothetical protein
MKRLNPNTGKPFKHGDIREDGYVFKQYSTSIKKDGYFVEAWFNPETWKKMRNKANEDSKLRQRNERLTAKGRASRLVHGAQQRVRKTGGIVTITSEWVAKKIEKGFCELTGIKFDLNPVNNQKRNPYSPSLDRIDSNNKNYSPDNVRVVLTAVNDTLSDYGFDVLFPILKGMVKYGNARKK